MLEPVRLLPDHILSAGLYLYGRDFRARLAQELKVSHKTVRAWLADPNGKSYRRVPPDKGPEILRLVREHRAFGGALADEIEAWIDSAGGSNDD